MSFLSRAVEFTGFGDGKGHLSFNKMVTFTALQTFVFAVVTGKDPNWALLSFGVIVVGAGFGLKGYLAAVKQNTLAATHTASTSVSMDTKLTGDLNEITKTVMARRDTTQGIDPA